MLVKYTGPTDPFTFTNGKEYEVIAIECGMYRITDETQEDYLYPAEDFDIVSGSAEEYTDLFLDDAESAPETMIHVLRSLEKEQISFICKECGLDIKELYSMNADQLNDKVYESLCDIECAETPSSDEPLSEHCQMAADLVTTLGNTLPSDDDEEE